MRRVERSEAQALGWSGVRTHVDQYLFGRHSPLSDNAKPARFYDTAEQDFVSAAIVEVDSNREAAAEGERRSPR